MLSAAKASGAYERGIYMMADDNEYFAVGLRSMER
jgi:hypothetical protein